MILRWSWSLYKSQKMSPPFQRRIELGGELAEVAPAFQRSSMLMGDDFNIILEVIG